MKAKHDIGIKYIPVKIEVIYLPG